MFYKFLLSILLAAFVSACSTTPKDTAKASGSGSTGSSDTVTSSEPSSGDAALLDELTNTPLGGPSIEPGTQEDLVVNVGDRVFFSYNSAELDTDAQHLLHEQAAWLKQHSNTSITIEGHCDE